MRAIAGRGPLLQVYNLSTASKNAHLATVIFNSKTNALALFRLRVENEDIRNIQRHRLVLNAAWLTNIRVRLDVLLGDIDALNQHATVRKHL